MIKCLCLQTAALHADLCAHAHYNLQLYSWGIRGIDPPAQVPQRDIIDAQMAFFGTGCIINEQVILQDQEGVLAWVSERLAVAMRQAEDLILRDYVVSAASEINAGGGSNGKVIAVVKLLMIDLELPLAA